MTEYMNQNHSPSVFTLRVVDSVSGPAECKTPDPTADTTPTSTADTSLH